MQKKKPLLERNWIQFKSNTRIIQVSIIFLKFQLISPLSCSSQLVSEEFRSFSYSLAHTFSLARWLARSLVAYVSTGRNMCKQYNRFAIISSSSINIQSSSQYYWWPITHHLYYSIFNRSHRMCSDQFPSSSSKFLKTIFLNKKLCFRGDQPKQSKEVSIFAKISLFSRM